ncbi:S-adenosyl-L-methionine-dependent methyltransferase [Aspergillus ambiguus]|uniref:rRNA (cytosine-C5-)-methyltransferase RCM1 n=1 Tax=Aspergillus ambiguus TaxID=176160 RepID=UPI003CCCE4E9
MSLYHDAVSVLLAPAAGGSFKSRLYSSRSLRASPAQIYALIVEAAKWDIVLAEVIDNARILQLEPKLTPLLALLLVHDHLLAKNGIAAPSSHPLRQSIERHKTRLSAEFVKARVRRRCASVAALKDAVRREKAVRDPAAPVYPRWVRVNNLRSSRDAQLATTFATHTRVASLAALDHPDSPDAHTLLLDPHIPDLLAFPPRADMSTLPAYRRGDIILQDKASCFPAYLLLGDEPDVNAWSGDLVDGCAAPGNKTTHLASLLAKRKAAQDDDTHPHIISMDASPLRAKTLQKMVATAGADRTVTVLPGQDFLALDHADPRFRSVAGLLLDPSCSGSGIIGRDDVPRLVLPADRSATARGKSAARGKKGNPRPVEADPPATDAGNAEDENELATAHLDPDRLTKLSNLQTRIVEHALGFPAAVRVTYSTCSIHLVENEAVVARVLASDVARRRGWRVLRRDEQPEGLQRWTHRGIRRDPSAADLTVDLSDEQLEGCLRCWPGDEEGTGGFFVAGFVRDGPCDEAEEEDDDDQEDEEWEGFSD